MIRLIDFLKQAPPPKLALAWTVLIITLLSIPGRDLPDVGPSGLDKPVHAFLFMVFTILWARSFGNHVFHSVGFAFLLALSFAVLSELYQGILPFERTPDKYDVVANWTGSVIGSLISIFLLRNTGLNKHDQPS